MTPISSSPGWVTRKPNTAGTAGGTSPAFDAQLQSLLQQTHTPTLDAGSGKTAGHLHPGGMNDSVHRLLKLGGR